MNNIELENEKQAINKFLESLYMDHPDGDLARSFMSIYMIFNHAIDDYIDEQEFQNPVAFLKIIALSTNVYTHEFYRKYITLLYPVSRFIHHTYADSLEWEKSDIDWKKNFSDCMRNIGGEMALSIIEILGGYDLRREWSTRIKEYGYYLHHDKDGNKI